MAAAASLLVPGVVLAHPGHTEAPALLAGLLHPLTGADHLLVMLGVGVWVTTRSSRRWAGPLAALAALALGVLWGAAGGSLPGLEVLLAGSLVVMGGMLTGIVRASPAVSGLAVMVLAGLHGYAHGAEMLPGTPIWTFLLGLALASLALQLAGIALGTVARKRLGGKHGLVGLPLLATGLWLMLGSA
jgi:urease accessory protein